MDVELMMLDAPMYIPAETGTENETGNQKVKKMPKPKKQGAAESLKNFFNRFNYDEE